MKIFITGATGFIGKQVVNLLLKTDHELICLVRKRSRHTEIPPSPRMNIIEGDIRDKPSLVKGMQGCDWVINLAGLYSYWEPDNHLYKEINVNGTFY